MLLNSTANSSNSFLFLIKRFLSSTHSRNICKCGIQFDDEKIKKIADSIIKRNSSTLNLEFKKCISLKNFDFKKNNEDEEICFLFKYVTGFTQNFLNNPNYYPDVLHFDEKSSILFLEGLKEEPPEEFVDFTGDHGKEIAKFINSNIGGYQGIIDIGGQNTDTIKKINKNGTIPSLILDINLVTPTLSEPIKTISYAIGDVETILNLEKFQKFVLNMRKEENSPVLFLFNNIFNVLKAEKSWTVIEKSWSILKKGDFLVISGLPVFQLRKFKFDEGPSNRGLVEFYKSGKFYKTAIEEDSFITNMSEKFPESQLEKSETFLMKHENQHLKINGIRFLFIRKS